MRPKTSIENYFLQTLDFFDKEGVDVMVQGSTLLNILRRGTIEPRVIDPEENPKTIITEDKEINLYILAEDFTDKLYTKMKLVFPYFKPINNRLPNSGIFFAQKEIPQLTNATHWDIKPGFTYLNRLWQGRNVRFKYQGGNNCILIPEKFVNDKKKWSTVEYLGRKIKAPANMKEYLTYYYGDWEKEDRSWHWSKSKNYITIDELFDMKEIPWGTQIN